MPADDHTRERSSGFPWAKFVVGGLLMLAGPSAWLLMRTLALRREFESLVLPEPGTTETLPPPDAWETDLDLIGPITAIGLAVVGFALVTWSFVQYERRRESTATRGPWR